VPVPVEIDEELYRRLAEAAAREGKDVQAYVNEIIRVQLREVERAHQIMSALDDIAGPDQED
jgi:predicted DNA-binding protein